MCGADIVNAADLLTFLGSPPRVRSRPTIRCGAYAPSGITSGCAEQTQCPWSAHPACWDHLRVCGADKLVPFPSARERGSPPRVRSRRRGSGSVGGWRGITSACAEQTAPDALDADLRRDHLRVCGADVLTGALRNSGRGSPPRVRSRHRHMIADTAGDGITSACAEQTPSRTPKTPNCWDHLRVCGADLVFSDNSEASAGSPPRVRSRRKQTSE